jgi:hypothetical protein
MYCSAVGTTLRAAPLAEVVLTGQVVRDVWVGRGALGGTSGVRLESEVRLEYTVERERPPPK